MYMFEDMIDMGLDAGTNWTSTAHKIVAINCCISNPAVRTKDILSHNVSIINSIPIENIKTVTLANLINMGCELI